MTKCTECWSENVLLVEYQGVYDGILEERCDDCGLRIHRFNRKEILSATMEAPYKLKFVFTDGTSCYGAWER